MKEGKKPEYQEKTPDDELQKMPHTKARKFKPQPRLELALWYWWQAGKAGVLTIIPRVKGGRNSSLVVFGLAVHSVAGSILLWGNFPVERIFPLELTWVQTPFPQKLFRMRV